MTQSQAGRALVELAVRVEAAGGPDRELDAEIGAAAGVMDFNGRHGVLGTPFYRVTDDGLRIQFCTRLDDGSEHSIASRAPRPFTASLDAAMTLLPEGYLKLERQKDDWMALALTGGWCRGATPALAVCAVALCARAASEGNLHV